MKKIKHILNRILVIILFVFIVLLIIESEPIISNFIGINQNDKSIESNFSHEELEEITKEDKVKNNKTNNSQVVLDNVININNDKLNIIFFNVGQADSTLITCNGQTLLIDAGNTYDGRKIVKGIKDLGIEKLDYVIGTHAHEDHLGGMSYIIDNFDIGNFYMPYCSSNEFSFYARLLTSLSNKNISKSNVEVGNVFTLGDGIFEVMGVKNNEPEDLNESAILVQFTYGNLKYLFMSDAEIVSEMERNWNDVDVLKVGHHGSNSGTSQEFLSQVLPEIAIISVGKDNDYGFPKEEVLERLYGIGSSIYRTDLDGTIQIISDGEKNEVVKIDKNFDGN